MMRIFQTNNFLKYVKRLPKQQKQFLDEAVKHISENPHIGELKKTKLSGLRIYKFKIHYQLVLLAYIILPDDLGVELHAIDPHENFYRDLSRLIH